MLFCALTNQLLHKDSEAVKQHLKGKRFTKAQGEEGSGAALSSFVSLRGARGVLDD